MSLFSRPTSLFDVTLHLDGRHPYLKETHLDYETQDVTVTVAAVDWNRAERAAFNIQMSSLPKCWRMSVKAIARHEP